MFLSLLLLLFFWTLDKTQLNLKQKQQKIQVMRKGYREKKTDTKVNGNNVTRVQTEKKKASKAKTEKMSWSPMVSLTSAGAALAFHYQRQPRRWLK